MNNHPETAPLTPAVTDGDLPGALVISLDFEQHWGVRDKHAAAGATRARLIGAREAVPAMLGAFRRYGVAATWATVGMLFAEDADRLRLSHPAVRPAYRDPNLAPYAEPVGDEAADPMHFALSLVR